MTDLKFVYAIAFTAIILPSQIAKADTSRADYIFHLDNQGQSCQQFDDGYQEIHAFETDNHVVNICQKGDNYYYLGETKTGQLDTVFLPANALELGEMYRASNGNIAYIVNILPSQATLTIERNGGQIAYESSLADICLLTEKEPDITAIALNQMDKIQILYDYGDLKLSRVETITLSRYDLGQAFLQNRAETALNFSSCRSLN